MKRFIFSCIFLLGHIIGAAAQETGRKVFPVWGLECTIPAGWMGQETNGLYLMASQTQPGLILLLPHQTTRLEDLIREAAQGLSDPDNGIDLRLLGDVQPIDHRAVAASYEGFFAQTAARAYAVGVINELGMGATVMVIAAREEFAEFHQALVTELLRSMNFIKPETQDYVGIWQEQLRHCRLTRMESYNSGYGNGGYNTTETIHLCREGYFGYYRSSNVSMDTGGAFGSSSGQGSGRGTWTVIADATTGQPVLQLSFDTGEIKTYTITWDGDKTFLNGERYFRTYGDINPGDGPVCER